MWARRGGGWRGSGAAACGFARGPENARPSGQWNASKTDRWRVRCVQEVEEKKREQELKAAALLLI
jgi:hypothetical protein